ncbi:MAG: carbamoyltransferase [Bdellovibrionales bacterium]|nr:carbamoyltransferase [Bdellovibrionales bacterium]
MKILGLSALYHDSAAALLIDGEIIAAAQEERFTRKRHDADLPLSAIRYCLSEGKISFGDLDFVVFYDKPFLKFERILETYMAYAPRGFVSFAKSMPVWISDKLFQKNKIKRELSSLDENFDWDSKLLFSEHHLSHAASTYYPSGFQEAIVLTMDGVGEWTTTSVAIGKGNDLQIVKEIHFPHSLGLLYSAITYHAGFKVNSGEYKLMGLAPYGMPVYKDKILNHLVDVKSDGTFRLDMKYFGFGTDLKMTTTHFDELFGFPARKPESQLQQIHMDLAASMQAALDEIVLKLARNLRETYKIPNLCLAGGVALNCVTNGRLLKEKIFDRIWIQPAAGDAGGALGAALVANYLLVEKQPSSHPAQARQTDQMKGSFLGPAFPQREVEETLKSYGANYDVLSQNQIFTRTAQALAQGKAIGWFQGRMEFGPRSLGARSILADPRSRDMQRVLNLKIKQRESFRPFAPAVLKEEVHKWFDMNTDSPYMLFVAEVQKHLTLPISEDQKNLFGIQKLNVPKSSIPSVTHVDLSARVQTVSRDINPKFHSLLAEFQRLTGCPVLVNTSFNVRGEPIVCTPKDALSCFLATDLDALVIENCFLEKTKQTIDPQLLGHRSFESD